MSETVLVPNRTCVVLLIPQSENRKITNTGMPAVRVLERAEAHVVGALGAPVDFTRVATAAATNLFLFPSERAQPLTPELVLSLTGPLRLIVPDGNWKQAERLRRSVPPAPPLRDVSLHAPPPSGYGLRRRSKMHPDGLATLEAIAYALEALEGPEISGPLLAIFRAFVDKERRRRGLLAKR